MEQTVRSGGLYGIESDSDREYLKSIADEEYSQLTEILKKIGVALPPFSKARWVERF